LDAERFTQRSRSGGGLSRAVRTGDHNYLGLCRARLLSIRLFDQSRLREC
jgi:hypothetical protein